MRNLICTSVATFILISKLDTGTWGIAIALLAVAINGFCQWAKDEDVKL